MIANKKEIELLNRSFSLFYCSANGDQTRFTNIFRKKYKNIQSKTRLKFIIKLPND